MAGPTLAIIITMPINLLIVFCIVKDIRETIEGDRKRQTSNDNLLSEYLYIDISDQDRELLDQLLHKERKTEKVFLRSKIIDNVEVETWNN